MTNKLKTTASTPETPRGQWFLEMIGADPAYPVLNFETENGEYVLKIQLQPPNIHDRQQLDLEILLISKEDTAKIEELRTQIEDAGNRMCSVSEVSGRPADHEAEREYVQLTLRSDSLMEDLRIATAKGRFGTGAEAAMLMSNLKLQMKGDELSNVFNKLELALFEEFYLAAANYVDASFEGEFEPPEPESIIANDYGIQAATALIDAYGLDVTRELVRDGTAGAVADALLNGEPGEA